MKTVAKDPVCGMEVDEKKAEFKANYKGTAYYFCSAVCMRGFKRTPEKYLGKSEG